MPLIKCPECQADTSDKAAACPKCGHPIAETLGAKFARRSIATVGQIIICAGAVALIIAPFLPWLTAGMLSASGFEETNNNAIVLCALGVVALIFGIGALVTGKTMVPILTLVSGVLAFGITAFYYSLLGETTGYSESTNTLIKLGPGIYFSFAGGVLVAIGAAMQVTKKKASRTEAIAYLMSNK